MLNTVLFAFAFTLTAIFLRAAYLICCENGKMPSKKSDGKRAKTLIVLGSGGHTTEMIRIIGHLSRKNYSPRVYVHADTDLLSIEKVKMLEGNNEDYKIVSIPRSRRVHQTYLSSVWTTIYATLASMPIAWAENPDLLLCNGPGTCIPLIMITQANLTTECVNWEDIMNDLREYIPAEIKIHLTSTINKLRLQETMPSNIHWVETEMLRIESCLDRCWETLNSGHWKNVPVEYRYCYTLCSFIKAILLELRSNISSDKSNPNPGDFEIIIKQVDKGILLGAPLPHNPAILTTIASRINHELYKTASQRETADQTLSTDDNITTTIFPGFNSIPHYSEPSMETFYRDIFVPKMPALLTGCMKHWQALNLWRDMGYLNKIIGARTIPIELGSRYTEENWTQSLVTFADFLRNHINKKSDQVGYLAQHQLFEQIPELKNDFTIPDYCSFSDKESNGDDFPDINAWFGPNGTVSPLHFDPKNNLLCQVFGCKRIILYRPEESPNLYPYETRMLNNTAQVDPYRPDDVNFPRFRQAQGFMCYLKPGEMLFIPPKWWHHVVSLSPSFSISFWWE